MGETIVIYFCTTLVMHSKGAEKTSGGHCAFHNQYCEGSSLPETYIQEPGTAGQSVHPEAPVDAELKDMANIIFSTFLLADWVAGATEAVNEKDLSEYWEQAKHHNIFNRKKLTESLLLDMLECFQDLGRKLINLVTIDGGCHLYLNKHCITLRTRKAIII